MSTHHENAEVQPWGPLPWLLNSETTAVEKGNKTREKMLESRKGFKENYKSSSEWKMVRHKSKKKPLTEKN